jgi:hypothetical protein
MMNSSFQIPGRLAAQIILVTVSLGGALLPLAGKMVICGGFTKPSALYLKMEISMSPSN